jgi:hypothetical protein
MLSCKIKLLYVFTAIEISVILLIQDNKRKWKYYPHKKFPWYNQFSLMIGTSSITGDWGQASAVQNVSGTGSSNPDPEDEPITDPEEREQFDFQEMQNHVDEATIQQPFSGQPTSGQQPFADTNGTANRTRSSNKRKSADRPEGSRVQVARSTVQSASQATPT